MDINDLEIVRRQIWRRNKIDFNRMFMHQGEPYTLRKYKMIFKREMEDFPDLYDVLDNEGEPKEHIHGIIAPDPRFTKNIPRKYPRLPDDYE